MSVPRPGSWLTRTAVLLWLAVSGVSTAQDRVLTPVTDEMLEHPDPADWLHWRRTLDGWGYSPLDQIHRGNADRLQLVWSWPLPPGLSQPTPLIHDGMMFIPNPLGVVQAVDAATGDRIWEYRKRFEGTPEETFRSRTRSLAIYGDTIFVTTSDAHIVALRAETGEVVWDHTVADYRRGYRYTSGAIVVRGMLVAGMTGCERYKEGGCFISAHDPATGAELWRTSTIAGPGEAGGDSWGDLPSMFRAGGDAWIPGSFDADLNRIYWGTAQPKPWARVSRKTDGNALYTNSVLALEPGTGELDWFYQFIPGESHDLDEAFESVLVDRPGRRSMFKMGKLGILWELDRSTGEFVAAHDLGYQTLVDVDRATGAVTYRPGMIPMDGVELEFCPGPFGIRNWPAMAYHPETRALYVPIHPHCTKAVYRDVEQVEAPLGDWYYYRDPSYTGWQTTGGGPHPRSPDHSGHLVAISVDSGEVLWQHSMRTRALAAALTTGGGIVVSADGDRYLRLHDVATGDVLLETRLPGVAQGYPVTYAVDGKQYLAVPIGGGRVAGSTNTLFVFGVPDENTTP
jgi:alcohol dehydrogenase (cytochrome c)